MLYTGTKSPVSMAMYDKLHLPRNGPEGYAFTEIADVAFLHEPDLENATTAEGQIWQATIRTYLDHPGMKTLWWGRRVGTSAVFKLIIDWDSFEARANLLSSPAFASLLQMWQASGVNFESSNPYLFRLPSWLNDRKNVFQPPKRWSEHCISVFLTFACSPGFDPSPPDPQDDSQTKRTMRDVWVHAWHSFERSALDSEGGVVSSKGAYGWSIDLDSAATTASPGKRFLRLLRFQNLGSWEDFFSFVNGADETWRTGGWRRLQLLAGDGISVECFRMSSANVE